MIILNREAILAAQDLQHETVAVPEWGGAVIVQMMTGVQRDLFTASLTTGADGKLEMIGYRAKLLVASVVDEQGNNLFTLADIEALNAKSSVALERLFAVAERLNAVAPGAVDAAAKN